MSKQNENLIGLNLWEKVRTPQHEHTKSFTRGGGFKGTSINGTAMAMMATEVFGPNGYGWGLEIEDEKYVEGATYRDGNGNIIVTEIVHVIRGHLWYRVNDEIINGSPQFGQTIMVGRNKYGPFTDEEAPKKSITDLQNKCLSLLGFASDIFLGKWDDNKYVETVKKTQAEEKKKKEAEANPEKKKKAVDEILGITTKINDALNAEDTAAIPDLKDEARSIWVEYNQIAPAEAAGLVKLMNTKLKNF